MRKSFHKSVTFVLPHNMRYSNSKYFFTFLKTHRNGGTRSADHRHRSPATFVHINNSVTRAGQLSQSFRQEVSKYQSTFFALPGFDYLSGAKYVPAYTRRVLSIFYKTTYWLHQSKSPHGLCTKTCSLRVLSTSSACLVS